MSEVAHDATRISLAPVLRRVQAVAGVLFSVFVTLHLANILIAPLGAEAFNGLQARLQVVYQHPLGEWLLVFGPILAHAVASVWLWRLESGRRRRVSRRARWHAITGVFLLVFIGGHIAAVRGPSLAFGIYPGFEGVAFSLWLAPFWFYPYYLALATAAFYHASSGLMVVARRSGFAPSPRLQPAATGVVSMLVLLALLAFDGVIGEGVAEPWSNDFARLGAALFGLSLPESQ